MMEQASPAAILAIGKRDIHRITSGQVVLDVQGATKELVENALDAGATSLEIRFKEYGAEAIEVIDNGTGIDASSYASLAQKHHTSKLTAFSDLTSVQTFGFRGEALSSLCELGRVQIVTSTAKEAPVGTVLELGRDGSIVSSDKKTARQQGTTVTVTDLFHTLPVRQRELEKNIKREFAKAQTLLQAYAIISRNVRWVVSNTVKGKRVPIMTISAATAQSAATANVNQVFGARVGATLARLDLSIALPMPKSRNGDASRIVSEAAGEGEREDDSQETENIIKVSGLISRPNIGAGRSSSDRCFLYINGRPWESSKFVRAFNDVYKQFNIQQYPMVVADFRLAGTDVDINVTPDKRTLFLHREVDLLNGLRMELERFFAPHQQSFRVNDLAETAQSRLQFRKTASSQIETKKKSDLEYHEEQEEDSDHEDERVDAAKYQSAPDRLTVEEDNEHKTKRPRLGGRVESPSLPHASTDTRMSKVGGPPLSSDSWPLPELDDARLRDDDESPFRALAPSNHLSGSSTQEMESSPQQSNLSSRTPMREREEMMMPAEDTSSTRSFKDEIIGAESRQGLRIHFDIGAVQTSLQEEAVAALQNKMTTLPPSQDSAILDAAVEADAATAESALSRTIEKSDFAQMQIIGQFNLGFILVRRTTTSGEDDLFIVDQHAADEKHNFEALNSSTRLQCQPLIAPQTMQLSPADEVVAAEHREALVAQGFDIRVDEDAEPGSRIVLHALPMSRRVALGVPDLEELLHRLAEERPTAERAKTMHCTKVRALLASRACRKSVMIGTPLNKKQMQTIVAQLGDLDQPWNCPHGRPTMRHLFPLMTSSNPTDIESDMGLQDDKDDITWETLL